jgi:predicted esterase
VQAVNNTELITFRNWTLRIRRAEQPRGLLLLLHGLTGDENSMWIFTRDLSPDYWFVSPRASHPAPAGGYSWRSIQDSESGRPGFGMLKSVANALIDLVDEYSASIRFDASQFDLLGFSQGAAVANVLLSLYPYRIRKTGILAGFVPSGLEEILNKNPLIGKPIFDAHGTLDEFVTIERARHSVALLEKAGAQVTFCEDEIGHKVSATCLKALGEFFAG